mgnify:FL=1
MPLMWQRKPSTLYREFYEERHRFDPQPSRMVMLLALRTVLNR